MDSNVNWDAFRFIAIIVPVLTFFVYTIARNECCKKLDGDTSVMTYSGHSVKNTLIRCRFSPLFTTGQVSLQLLLVEIFDELTYSV